MSDGGFVVPAAFVDEVMRATKVSAWRLFSEETLEDLGYPPRPKGLAYWHRLERDRIRNARLSYRLRRFAKRARWTLDDVPRRLRNARAALAGEWEAGDE